MAIRRSSIKLLEHELKLLKEMFLTWRIPIDQFDSRPDELAQFTEVWNDATGRNNSGSELVHCMKTFRKRGLWVRLDGNYSSAPPLPELSAEETEALVDIFYEHVTMLENGSDVLSYDDEISTLIAKEFAAASGRFVHAHELVAKLTALRKRGLLPKVGLRGHASATTDPDDSCEDIGFSDIVEVDRNRKGEAM